MKRIKIDRDKSEDTRSRITIDSNGKYAPIFCRHCDRPECVYTCMTGAMSKNKETGLVEYNKDHCASCYMCVMACPYGVLKADNRTKKEIMKCDGCEAHGTAQCVERCPMAAITLEEVTE